MTGFWKTWMTVWCWGVFVFGVVLALSAVPGANAAPRAVITLIGGDPALLDQPALQFAFGLQGALTMGWAIMMFGMLSVADIGGAPVWRSMTFGMAVWYVIDSAISVATGLPLNAVSNTLLLVTFLAPILATGVLGGSGRTATA